MHKFKTVLLSLIVAGPLALALSAHGHGAADHAGRARHAELGMSAAFDQSGALWVVSKESTSGGDYAVLRSTPDNGKTWTPAHRVNVQPEPISADGENRPKLAFGPRGEMVVTWTKPTSKNYTGDIRFARSIDNGHSWTAPVNVHRDKQLITHRFESLFVDRSGRVYVAWIDKRDQRSLKPGQAYAGAALYYAVSDDGGASWRGDFKVADHSCECCRIALAADADGQPYAFWRHVFEGSERDHALLKLTPDGKPGPIQRATFDAWKVDACPHQGPALAVATQDGGMVRHAVWFNMVGGEGRVFYGQLLNGTVQGQRTLPDARAEHAAIVARGDRVWIVWKSFDGEQTGIGMMTSHDGGQIWSEQALIKVEGSTDQPRLLLHGELALLVWNTERNGIVLKELP